MRRPGLMIVSTAVLALAATATLAGPASATFKGRNGRLAWAVWNPGGGGGGGFASLTTSNRGGGARRQLGYCPEDNDGNVCQNWYDVTYSPNGTRLLWNQPDPSGHRVIIVAKADASAPTVVDHETADDSQASFSPNGRRIVYIRQPVGEGGEFGTIVTSDLAGANVRVISATLQAAAPEVTPDGKHILFVREGAFSSPGGLWSIGINGRHLHRLIPHALAFDISPDGRHVAYVDKPGDLRVANVGGSRRGLVARRPDGMDPIVAVRYSPNGKLLVFSAMGTGRAGGDSVFTVGVDGGRTRTIRANGDGRTSTTGLAWQPRPG